VLKSEIHLQVRVTHALARECQMAMVQTVDESCDTLKHGGGAHGWRWLPEMHRSDFEKIKTKNFSKRAEGANLRMRVIVDAIERWIYREGVIDVVIKHKKQ
jgi:hypothetical protein